MLQEAIELFRKQAPSILPELFGGAKANEAEFEEDMATISYQLPRKHDMEDVMDMLEDQMELTMLYHFIPSQHTDFGHQCCAYSNILFGSMFKIHGSTDADGEIDSLTVTLYSSMEAMCTDLLEDVGRHEGRGTFRHKLPKEAILVEFC